MKQLLENWNSYLLKEAYILNDDFMESSISSLFSQLKDYGDNTWIFFDTETSGFGPEVNQLTEIGAISSEPNNWQFSEPSAKEGMFYDKMKLTADTQDRFRRLQQAKDRGEELEDEDFKFALKLTRYGMKKPEYREKYPKGMPEEIDVIKEFLAFVKSQPNPVLVAQNAEFDINFVQGRAEHYGLDADLMQYPIFDTLTLLKLFHNPLIRTMADKGDERAIEILEALTVDGKFGSYVSASMGVVSNAYDVNTDEWHNALADVKMMMEMTRRIFETLQQSVDEDIAHYQGRAAYGIRKQKEKKAARAARAAAAAQTPEPTESTDTTDESISLSDFRNLIFESLQQIYISESSLGEKEEPDDIVEIILTDFMESREFDDTMDAVFKHLAPNLVRHVMEREINEDMEEFKTGAIEGRFEKRGGWDYEDPSPEQVGEKPDSLDYKMGYTWGWNNADTWKGNDLPSDARKTAVEAQIKEFEGEITEQMVIAALEAANKKINPWELLKTAGAAISGAYSEAGGGPAGMKAAVKKGMPVAISILVGEALDNVIIPITFFSLTGIPIPPLPVGVGEIINPIVINMVGAPEQEALEDEFGRYEKEHGVVSKFGKPEIEESVLREHVRFLLLETTGRPKVIFMAGAPGSGKSTVIRRLGLSDRLEVINPDDQYETCMAEEGIPFDKAALLDEYRPIKAEYLAALESGDEEKVAELESDYLRLRDILVRDARLFGAARRCAGERKRELTQSGKEYLVDGTGGNYNEINSQVRQLRENGYDVAMIFIDVPLEGDEGSFSRNTARGARGGRRLADFQVERSWKAVSKNREKYKALFGDNFFYISNVGEGFEEGIDDISAGIERFLGGRR